MGWTLAAEAALAVTGANTTPAITATPTRASHPGASAVVLHAPGDTLPAWSAHAAGRALPLPARRVEAPTNAHRGELDTALARALVAAECVLIDAETLDPLPAARRVHEADADVQVVVVVGSEEHRRALERAMLFAPGIGEIWLASPNEVAGAIAERAAGVTRQRRKFRRTRERLVRDGLEQSPQRIERALISDAYLADLLQVLPDPVFSVDAAGRILSLNPAAERLLGRPGPALVGAALATALGTSDRTTALGVLAGAVERPSSAEVAFRHADGTTGHGALLASRVAASEPPFFAVVLHDLTERHQAQQRLEDQAVELEHQSSMLQDQAAELEQANEELLRQREELETALASRSRFYAAMSHELRTPINAVVGYTSLALEGIYGPLSDPLGDALTRSQRAASHLRELVDDVLDLAKIEAGRIDVQKQPVDVVALLEDLLLSVQPPAAATNTTVALDCATAPAAPLVTDPRRVRQILLNLVGNAIKFGAGQTVTLRCASTAEDVVFSVVDEGPGIPEREQHRIFEEFVQLAPDVHQGTGLGLSISRRLAELLGGTLTVASAPGGGSTFTLALPRG